MRFREKYLLEMTVFVCGAMVMIYEIIGSRLVSPFLGTSTYIWTSLIGVILASLSIGYWLGGKLADRRPEIGVLAFVVLAAGGCVSATVLLKDVVLSVIAAGHFGLEFKSFLAALTLFAPASVCLGVVTPFAVKIKMSSLADTGKTVGRLYAISTVGSITGTFAAGFFLIPFVGSVRTLYMIAASLIGLSLVLVPFALTRTSIAAIVLFIVGIAASEINIGYLRSVSGLYDIDTEYSRVQVFRTLDPKSGRPLQAMATDPYFVQSAMFTDSDELALDYNHYYHLIRHFKPDFRSTLMIGGAGYTFPREYLRTYSDAQIHVVEIDPEMTQIAKDFFRLADDPRLVISHMDGRVFLNQAERENYDAVLMDAFGSLFSVPYQLTTVEAVQEINRILKPDGVVVFNLGSAITGDSSGFLQAEFKTYQKVFPQVYLFKVNQNYPTDRLQNLMIVAAKSRIPLNFESADPAISSLLAHRYTDPFPLDNPVLTDDLSPVEYYNSIAQNRYLRSR